MLYGLKGYCLFSKENIPTDWDVRHNDMQWYDSLLWLKTLAHLPIEQNIWLSLFFSIKNGEHLLEKLVTIQYGILDIHRNNVCSL